MYKVSYMYCYTIKSNGFRKYNMYSNEMNRVVVLAKTLFPNSDIQVDRCIDRTGLCSGCKEKIKADTKCSCWGYS